MNIILRNVQVAIEDLHDGEVYERMARLIEVWVEKNKHGEIVAISIERSQFGFQGVEDVDYRLDERLTLEMINSKYDLATKYEDQREYHFDMSDFE